jgi:YihY family inner membrane protein
MSILARLDHYQRRHTALGLPLAVIYKAAEDRAPYLAAAVAYYGFVSLFPLLLLVFTVSAFVLDGHPGLRDDLLHSIFAQFPGLGPSIRDNLQGLHGSGWALGAGVLGTVYGTLGVMQAAQTGFNQIYAVPRNRQPNPLRSRLRSLGLLLVLGSGLTVSATVSVLAAHTTGLTAGWNTGVQVLIYVLAVAANAALFAVALKLLTPADLRMRDVAVGGVITAAAWQVLQVLAGPYLSNKVQNAGALYGTFALVLALIAWIYLVSLAVMLSAEVNVVISRRLWPRALLTPFTDDVDLTDVDRRVYAMHAAATQFKGFETVTTEFLPRQRPDRESLT